MLLSVTLINLCLIETEFHAGINLVRFALISGTVVRCTSSIWLSPWRIVLMLFFEKSRVGGLKMSTTSRSVDFEPILANSPAFSFPRNIAITRYPEKPECSVYIFQSYLITEDCVGIDCRRFNDFKSHLTVHLNSHQFSYFILFIADLWKFCSNLYKEWNAFELEQFIDVAWIWVNTLCSFLSKSKICSMSSSLYSCLALF